MQTQALIPVFGVIVGWILNETGQKYKKSKEEKKPLAKALSELLELRNTYQGVQLLEDLRIKMSIPDLFWPVVRSVVLNTLLNNDVSGIKDLSQRYNDAVTAISEIDPLLGYKLRNNDVVPKLINHLGLSLEGTEAEGEQFEMFSKYLDTLMMPLENSILLISKKYGFFYHLKIKKHLKEKKEDKPGFETVMNQMKELWAPTEDMNISVQDLLAAQSMLKAK
ncbi:hypothetical protein [Cohnella sp. JJ-181]|uniref:hypothetical protein n=1 Tax=Cohnella rhizoplanae TaxID=2974897 RepID=UPI0022FF8CB8|nr:hypothetical protein [Cohnella sp. JJ-181]CAI6073972.1 hypothetical protein COHCIP112018_02407 [Cohnella sp. JJ-181]